MEYRYFSEKDFRNAIPSCSIEDMSIKLILKLDTARHIAGCPFVILSAYRDIEWEKENGRSGTSSHILGLAVDIVCNDSTDRLKMIDALLAVGFKRIGIYESFIHVDCDDFKIDCIWYGK